MPSNKLRHRLANITNTIYQTLTDIKHRDIRNDTDYLYDVRLIMKEVVDKLDVIYFQLYMEKVRDIE